MDYSETKKLKLAFPWFYINLPKDIIMEIMSRMQKSENNEYLTYKISGWDINFDDSFDIYSYSTKIQILDLVTKKYSDFNDMVYRVAQKMESQFCESGRCNANGSISYLDFKHLDILEINGNDVIKFAFVVAKNGKRGNVYYMSGGKLTIKM